MKILYLTTVLPSKRKTGSEIASQCFINALKQSGHEVLIVGYQRKNDVSEKSPREITVDERYIETEQAIFYPILWMVLSFIKNLPYSSSKYYSKTYVIKVNSLLSENPDAVIIDHPQLAWLEALISNKAKIISIHHNIEHEIYLAQFNNVKNYIRKWIYKREACLIKDMENKLANTAKEVWTLTSNDCRYFSSVKKGGRVRVFAVPSSLKALPDRLPKVKKYDVGIIGTWTWKPNMEGLKWFFQAVYPHLLSNLSIHVAGKGAEWLHGQYSNVKYCGFVLSAQAFMEQAKVIAIPSISGSGIQIKTLDAIASGSPVVATPVALRGISEYPCSVTIAERPEEFANSLTQLLAFTTQEFCRDGIAWSQNRREKFFASVTEAIDAFQREKVLTLVDN